MSWLCKIIGHKYATHTHMIFMTDLYCKRCGNVIKLSREVTNKEDKDMKK